MEDAPKTRLDRWMRETGRNDARVAEEISPAVNKISRSQINRLRNGAAQPSWPVAMALEELTGIPAGDLLRPMTAQPRDVAA